MSALLVLVGLAFGPPGLGVLTPVLTFMEPAVPVALAVLGVLVAVYGGQARGLVITAIVAGAMVLAVLREASVARAVWLVLQSCGIALLVAVSGWLLLLRSSSSPERRVFVIAVLLLLGGAAGYLSLSGALSGLIAGFALRGMDGALRHAVLRDIQYVHHPLFVMLLVFIGATVALDPEWLVLAGTCAAAAFAGTFRLRGLPA